MTPFEAFFASTIAPTLPKDCPPDVLKAIKEPLAACWNAALTCIGVEMNSYDFIRGDEDRARLQSYILDIKVRG